MTAVPKPEKKPKKAKPKVRSKTVGYRNDNDAIVRLILKKRAPYCIICGKHESELPSVGNIPALCVGHYYRRGKMFTRWDLRNVHRQCISCNQRHEHNAAFYNAFMLQKYDTETLAELAELAKKNAKPTIAFLLEENQRLLKILNGEEVDYGR